MLNRCEFIGHLGRDPEVRTTQRGGRVASLRVAVTDKWRAEGGERKERTEWVSVVIWNEKVTEVAEKYLRKGSKVYLSGQLQTRKWTDQSGQERYSTEVVLTTYRGELVLLDWREQGAGRDDDPEPRSAGRAPQRRDDLDDEIPF